MRLSLITLFITACVPDLPTTGDLRGAAALADRIEVERLMPSVEALAAGHLTDERRSCENYPTKEGYPSCELTSSTAATFVFDELTAAGLTPRVVSLGVEPHVAHNVVAELPGTTRASEVVLIAAHHDAFYAGADDNGSGVAALLAIARAVVGNRFARTIRFVAFDLEERGSLGSTHFAAAGLADDVVAALVLECVGLSAPTQDSPPLLPLPSVGDFLLIVANEDSRELAQRLLVMNAELDLLPLRAMVASGDGAFPLTSPLTRSDNGPLWLRGVPTVMLSDTANFRNPNYHEAGDLPDTLDPAFLAAATRLAAAGVALFAEMEVAP
jgi:hypothetical protein